MIHTTITKAHRIVQAGCKKSHAALIVLRIIAITVAALIAIAILSGCVTLQHTFADGTRVEASDTGRVSVRKVWEDGNKSVLELELPTK